MDFPQSVSLFGFLSVSAVAMFSFIAVVVWSQERRREREAYYRSETLKKIAEAGAGGTSAVEFLREEQGLATRRRKEGLKLAGLITSAIGLALMVFIGAVDRGSSEPAYLVGIIPLFIGAALLAYVYVMAAKE
jgi:Domain of unknown function (DUF6249)